MRTLDFLRQNLKKDYPEHLPTFKTAKNSFEMFENFSKETIIPAFLKIKEAFSSFHFEVKIRQFARSSRLDITDGCSYFAFSAKVHRKYAVIELAAAYRDQSICSYNYKERILLESAFDMSRITEELSAELIINIFSETFINRKISLQAIVERERIAETEKSDLHRELIRSTLIRLKRENNEFDPEDAYRKYLDSPEYEKIRNWLKMHFE